jgi:hypothetical protein
MQKESKIYNIHAKTPTPTQTKSNHKLPLKPSHMGGKHQVLKLKRVVTKPRGFSMQKSILPSKTKANQTKRQTQQKTPTPPKVESTRFHQLSLDTHKISIGHSTTRQIKVHLT